MEIHINPNEYISESRRRKKKGKNKRSAMLRIIMPHLSRDTGDALADAIDSNNVNKFKATWDKVKKEISKKLMESKSSDEEEDEYLTSVSSIDMDEMYEELVSCIVADLDLE